MKINLAPIDLYLITVGGSVYDLPSADRYYNEFNNHKASMKPEWIAEVEHEYQLHIARTHAARDTGGSGNE